MKQGVPAERVSTLELFFDLVFVFIITQISELMIHHPTPAGVVRALMVLSMTWWMYGGYAWLTNNVGTTRPIVRVFVLAGMAGFLVMALAVPRVFEQDGLAFGLAYLFVNVVHGVLFLHAPNSSARAILRIAPLNLVTALLIVAAGLVHGTANVILWAVAVASLYVIPLLGRISGFVIHPAHFIERHGLVLIIALGESVISIGAGALGHPVTPTLVTAAILGLALNGAIWWSYFAWDERAVEHAMARVDGAQRTRMALNGFGYGFLVMLMGIVMTAAGLKLVFEHLDEPASSAMTGLLGTGIALYLLGDAAFRRIVGISPSRIRLLVIALVLATIPLGRVAGGMIQVLALLGVFGIIFTMEWRVWLRTQRGVAVTV